MLAPGPLLRRYGLSPRKSWGQNFLHDRTVVERIAALVDGPRVFEIGAGLGALTSALCARGLRVDAIERDRDLVRVLRLELGHLPNLRIHEADAVRFEYRSQASSDRPPEVAGNLPYHLTGPLLFRLLEFHDATGPWTVMVQREVGERLAAAPGSRSYGAATVSIGRVRTVEKVLSVPRGAFLPPPRVDSVVLRLAPRPTPAAEVPDPADFPRFVQRIFQGRRKRLSNALAFAGPRPKVLAACEAAGADPSARCETLPVEVFARLHAALSGAPDA